MDCARYVGISSEDEFDEYLGNHLRFTCQLDDIASHSKDDKEKLTVAINSGRTKFDIEKNILTDPWGLMFKFNAASYYNYGHPLSGIEENPEMLDRYLAPSLDNMDLLFGVAEKDRVRNGDNYLTIVSGYNGVWEKSYELVGLEEFIYLLSTDFKTAERLMDIITDYKVRIAQETVKRGFKVGHHGDDLGTQISTIISEDMFVKILLPRIKRIFDVYKGAGIPVQMHSCGKITPFIPYLIDAGLDILEPVQPCMDITKIKNEYGNDLIFFGGIDTQELLAFKSPSEVRKETLRTISILGARGGYICAPAQEIMNNVPPENVEALVSTIREARGD